MIQMKLFKLLKPSSMARTFPIFPTQAPSFHLRVKYSAASLAPDHIMTQTEAINGFFPTNGYSKKVNFMPTNGKAMQLTQDELAKLNHDFTKMTEEIQTKVSNRQVSLVNDLEEISQISITKLKELTKKGRLEELSLMSKQIKETHANIIATLQRSKAASLKEIQELLSKLEKKSEISPKNKNLYQRFKGKLLRAAFQSIKKQSFDLLLKEKSEIDTILKRSWQSYFERVKLNKKDDREWFEDKFVDESYGKDLMKIKRFVEESGADFYLKLNDLILMANEKFEKKGNVTLVK